jgi:hypothetical protein
MQLVGVDRARQRLVEAEAERVQPRLVGIDRREVDDPETRSAATLEREVVEQRRTRRRLADDRDVRPGAFEKRDEHGRIVDHPHAVWQGQDGPVGREGDPGRSGPEVGGGRLAHAGVGAPITGYWAAC